MNVSCDTMHRSLKRLKKPVVKKYNRLLLVLKFTGLTYVLQRYNYYCLFECVTICQVLEYIGTHSC